MPTLFDPLKVGNMELDNRIVMGPMTRSRANDEGVQPDYAATTTVNALPPGSSSPRRRTSRPWRKVISAHPESIPMNRLKAGDL